MDAILSGLIRALHKVRPRLSRRGRRGSPSPARDVEQRPAALLCGVVGVASLAMAGVAPRCGPSSRRRHGGAGCASRGRSRQYTLSMAGAAARRCPFGGGRRSGGVPLHEYQAQQQAKTAERGASHNQDRHQSEEVHVLRSRGRCADLQVGSAGSAAITRMGETGCCRTGSRSAGACHAGGLAERPSLEGGPALWLTGGRRFRRTCGDGALGHGGPRQILWCRAASLRAYG